MKLEKLKNDNPKKIIIGVIATVCIISSILFIGSRAKYKGTQSVPLIEGTINYKAYDFKMMAMYQQTSGDNYTEITTMPTSGYAINQSKSYCTTDNKTHDTTAKLYTDNYGQHVIENLKQNDKCYIWFDKKQLNISILQLVASLNPTVGATSFTGPSTTNEGLKSGTDDDGTTYYFRGNVTNNWVKFAGFYWRIVRINGDGSIRLIYNGTSTTPTGTTTQIETSAFNTDSKDNAYVGYMYGTTPSTSYADAHANINDSTIKGELDKWYKTNIYDKGFDGKVSKEAGFCNDRSIASSNQTWWASDTKKGYGENATAYGPYGRIGAVDGGFKTTQKPKFSCTNASSDLFTVNSSTKGNKKLSYPVGLITADEVIYAGGFGGTDNSSYYLYTYQTYWALTPYTYPANSHICYVGGSGALKVGGVGMLYNIRPVINLASTVTFTYNNASTKGTASDPYVVS